MNQLKASHITRTMSEKTLKSPVSWSAFAEALEAVTEAAGKGFDQRDAKIKELEARLAKLEKRT